MDSEVQLSNYMYSLMMFINLVYHDHNFIIDYDNIPYISVIYELTYKCESRDPLIKVYCLYVFKWFKPTEFHKQRSLKMFEAFDFVLVPNSWNVNELMRVMSLIGYQVKVQAWSVDFFVYLRHDPFSYSEILTYIYGTILLGTDLIRP